MAPTTSRRGFLGGLAAASLSAGLLSPGLTEPVLGAGPTARLPGAGPLAEPDWDQVRAEFLPTSRVISLNSANMSPAPRSVVTAFDEATQRVDADVSYQNRARYADVRERARESLARMVGARSDEIALVRNASEANNIVVGGIDLRSDDEVLLFEQNHPTNNVAWDVQAARTGFAVRRIALPASPARPDELLDRFTAAVSPRTRVIAFSHVSNVSGLRIPAGALCAWARERNIYTHVDGAQTFGAMALDLTAMGCDSFGASGQKWLMGPREIGFLYVREARQREIWPGVVGVGWGNTPAPAVRGARKYETMGQRNDATMAALDAALAFHDHLGHDRIVRRTAELATRVAEGLGRVGLPLVTPTAPDLRLAVVIVRAEAATAGAWHERLYREHGVITSPTGGLRFSPSVCVTLADIDRALEAVSTVTRT